MADGVAGLGGFVQQVQPLNLSLGIQPPVGAGALRLHHAVAFFPDADDVDAQPGAAGDDFYRVMRVGHKPRQQSDNYPAICKLQMENNGGNIK